MDKNNKQLKINRGPDGSEPGLEKSKVRELRNRQGESGPRYIEMKHVASEDTANVRITNKRGNTCQIVQEDVFSKKRRWVEMDKKLVIADMAEVNLDELRDTFKAEDNAMWRQWYR